MITALDAASACTMPAAAEALLEAGCGPSGGGWPGTLGRVEGDALDTGAALSPERIARSVCATRTASAFFRYTTWMLPAVPVGTSSCCTIACTRATRAGLSERTIRLLVRG